MIAVKTIETWSRYSEYFIGVCSVLISSCLAYIYHTTLSDTATEYSTLFYVLMMSYPLLCLIRLGAIKFTRLQFSLLSWLNCTFDILYVTAFSYFLSVHFGTAAATFKSPSFLLYFVLIALHALRLRPLQILFMGVLSIALWMTLLSLLTTGGLSFDVSFIDNATSEFISTKAEVMKLGALAAFTGLVFLTTLRCKNLFNSANEVQDLEKTLSQAHRSIQMKTEVLGHVSHDMRGPIGGVINMSEALRRTNLTTQQTRYVSAIEESSQAILDAVETMLNVADVDIASEDTQEREPANDAAKLNEFHLRPTLESIVESFGIRARSKNVELLLDDQTDRDFIIGVSPKHLTKVLSNILDNAIKFTSDGSIVVTLNCETLNASMGTLSISVTDTGEGIKAEYLSLLKERLLGKVQFSSTTGMGLVIAQMFLQSKGSELDITSEFEEGTTVTFDINVPLKAYKLSLSPIEGALKKLTDLKVLIVDDKAPSSDILAKQLKKAGMVSTIASDANSACVSINEAYAAGKPFDLAIIDYDMPEINGLKLVQTIRSQLELDDMKLMVTLTTDDRTIESQFSTLDVSPFLKKPFGLEQLRHAIAKSVSIQEAE